MTKTLSTGKEVTLKEISIDEKDELLDSVKYEDDKDGKPTIMVNPHTTLTKWIRIGLDGDISDEFLKTLTFKELNLEN